MVTDWCSPWETKYFGYYVIYITITNEYDSPKIFVYFNKKTQKVLLILVLLVMGSAGMEGPP